jgi:DNA-binding LacI/PurR family transcriptional regulator
VNRRPVALLTNDPDEVFQRGVIAGAMQAAELRGYSVSVHTIRNPEHDIDAIEAELRASSGALVLANVLPDAVLRRLRDELGVPVSLVAHLVPDLHIPGIAHNNRQGMAILMEHIVNECGRRQPVFICGDMHQNDGRARRTGFELEMMRYDLDLDERYFIRGEFIPAAAARAMTAFLAEDLPFDAVVAADYQMAISALDMLRAHGIRVPDDVSVIGFGDGIDAVTAGLTTLGADIVSVGKRAMYQLFGQLEGLTIRGLTVLNTHLIVRETSLPYPTKETDT